MPVMAVTTAKTYQVSGQIQLHLIQISHVPQKVGDKRDIVDTYNSLTSACEGSACHKNFLSFRRNWGKTWLMSNQQKT